MAKAPATRTSAPEATAIAAEQGSLAPAALDLLRTASRQAAQAGNHVAHAAMEEVLIELHTAKIKIAAALAHAQDDAHVALEQLHALL